MKFDKNHMTSEQLWKLRKDVIVGSLFFDDYENLYDIDVKYCCAFFDGYLEYLEMLMEEDGISDGDFWDYIPKYDNTENLFAWYNCYENPFGDE